MDRLIEAVKNTPCLWDTSNPAYKDYEIMDRAWSQVAEEVNFPDGKYAKMQWKKLRDNFREALKRHSDQHKRSKRTVKEWRFKHHMEFLIPYMQSKGLDFNSSINDNIADESCDVVQYSDSSQQNLLQIPVVVQLSESENSSKVSQNFVKVDQDPEADNQTNVLHISEVYHCSEVPHPPASESPHSSQSKRQKTWGEYIENGEIQNDLGCYFQGKGRKSAAIAGDAMQSRGSDCFGIKKGDALLSFFSSMYNTTSQLSPQMQLQVKRKIFDVVTEAEESSFSIKQEQNE